MTNMKKGQKFGKAIGMGVVIMFMMTGIMAAMPTARAEEGSLALYSATLVTEDATYPIGEIIGVEGQVPAGIEVGAIGYVLLEKIKDLMPGTVIYIPNTVGVEITYPDMGYIGVRYGIGYESNYPYYRYGPWVWIDTATGSIEYRIWVFYGYQPGLVNIEI